MLFYAFAEGDVRVIEGIRMSVKHRMGSLRRSLTVKLPSLALTLVSILPLFIPFFLYTAPYLLCRYVYTMARAVDKPMNDIQRINEEIDTIGDIKQ